MDENTRNKLSTILMWIFPPYSRIRFEWDNLRLTFLFEEYKWLTQGLKSNTTLLDFGAAMGDTPIYFARVPEIKKIIAFEPSIKNYKIACENIAKLPKEQQDKIIMLWGKAKLWDLEYQNVIIKSDCEGAEHKIFTKDTNLSHVYKIMLEYHGGVKNLKKVLKSKGFSITIESSGNTLKRGEQGMLMATKII